MEENKRPTYKELLEENKNLKYSLKMKESFIEQVKAITYGELKRRGIQYPRYCSRLKALKILLGIEK